MTMEAHSSFMKVSCYPFNYSFIECCIKTFSSMGIGFIQRPKSIIQVSVRCIVVLNQ